MQKALDNSITQRRCIKAQWKNKLLSLAQELHLTSLHKIYYEKTEMEIGSISLEFQEVLPN